MSYYAVDFGTSNSLLTHVSSTGVITPIPLNNENEFVLRSIFYTPEPNRWYFGSEAIDHYVENEGSGRFFRSIKKFLPEPGYSGTVIHNKNATIIDLVAIFLGEMKKRADKFIGHQVDNIILGRPALYSMDKSCDELAEERMRKAALQAGFKEVLFCPEPIAAGLDYQTAHQEERIVLIADYGGGTSDFTLMKFDNKGYSKDNILGLSGVFMAGDALDGVMMKSFISPHFGANFEYKIPSGNNILKFPRNLLEKICSPAHITHLRERDTWEFLQHIQKFALSEEHQRQMNNLFTLVDSQLGFPVFNEIERVKVSLGKNDSETFKYEYLDLNIIQQIEAIDYFVSVWPVVEKLSDTLNEVFRQSGLTAKDVHQVCLTGGTSQFGPIQKELGRIFGKDKISGHNIYQSVVNGLAQYGKQLVKQS